MKLESKFADRMARIKPSAIRKIMEQVAKPGITSFAGGLPDPELFPVDKLRSLLDDVLSKDGKIALQYSATAGLLSLREKISARMKKAGVNCGPENVLVVQGGQQGLDLMGKLFLNKGDTVITENPTFLSGLSAIEQYEANVKCCGMDQDGLRLEELEEVLRENPGVKFLYTISDFQNPMGVTLSLARRKKLLELAAKYDFIILEDSPYREIRYDGEHVPSIKSLDTDGRVVFVGSFSKILSPGMRLGWVVASEAIISKLSLLKQPTDTQCSTLNQCLVDRFIEKYDLDEHINGLIRVYKRKKDLMLQTMKETFPSSASWTNPEGGLFTWLTIDPRLDAEAVLMEHLLDEARAAYVPGAAFFPLQPERNHARINFSEMSEEAIRSGIGKMGATLKKLG